MDLLYLPNSDQSVLQRHIVGERLIATVVNERNGEVRNPMHTTMVVGGGETGNIEQTNPTRASQVFLVARTGQFDGPSGGSFPRTIIVGFSTSWSS